jgi:hypothetical protein
MHPVIDLHRRGYLRGVERQLSAAQRSNTTLRSSIGMAHTLRGVCPVSTDTLKNGRHSLSGFAKGLNAHHRPGLRVLQREGLSYRSASS